LVRFAFRPLLVPVDPSVNDRILDWLSVLVYRCINEVFGEIKRLLF